MIDSSQFLEQLKKRPIAASVGGLILFIVIYVGLNARLFGEGVNEGFLEKANEAGAAAINARVPIKMDDVTSLISAKAKSDGLLYNYKTTLAKDEIDGDVEKVLKPDTVEAVCKDTNARKLLNMGDTYYYSYADKNDVSLGEFKIIKADCK